MATTHQTPEEAEARMVSVGSIYQQTDHPSARLIVRWNNVAYSFNDPRVFEKLVLKHCSERHLIKGAEYK